MNYRLYLILSIASILSGCGGGGGNSESDVPPVVTQNKSPSISVVNAPSEVAKGQSLTLSVTANDEDGSIASVIWRQSTGQNVLAEPIDANSITLDLAPASSFTPTEYAFTVTATDNQGATATANIRFMALNRMDQFASSRLLHQGSMGPTLNEIRQLQGLSEQQWLDEQIALPVGYHRNYLTKSPGEDEFGYINRIDAWWKAVMRSNDQLRQRVAFALSEILVVSDANNGLRSEPEAMVGYYDLLLEHAFGNYRDLLEAVTLSPVMGTYLSHLGNEKADEALNIRPDENYAREVMQLFTIGLDELNLNGTLKLDAQGNSMATFGQDEIQGFARVFTGWTFADNETFKRKSRNYIKPMKAFAEYHSNKQKVLLNGQVIPPDYGPQESLDIALDNLFNHPNVAPFITKQLIQRLITSNPTSQYVERVASVFNDNGQGVRGDLAAVIKAIYLDDEARHFGSVLIYQGKIKEPILKVVQFWRNLDARALDGEYRTWNIFDRLGQGPMRSPSVFNFFRPDYQPAQLRADGLLAPELQIAGDATLIGTMNEHYSDLVWGVAEKQTQLNSSSIYVYLQNDMNFLQSNGIEALLDQYNVVYYAGSMSEHTRQALLDLDAYFDDEQYPERVSYLLYMIAISPEFNLQY
jgi:uncharacterized protein (DUF1800 family)